MENMELWNRLKRPPEDALKKITGGRLKNMTDINPQWRYQAMTEVFGPCGVGWKFTVDRKWREEGSEGQAMAFADVSLYVKMDGEWSDPIPGSGGAMLVEMESKGLHTSDEGYKKAVTDALSTAMKMVGTGADIYRGFWDGSKYRHDDNGNGGQKGNQRPPANQPPPQEPPPSQGPPPIQPRTTQQAQELQSKIEALPLSEEGKSEFYGYLKTLFPPYQYPPDPNTGEVKEVVSEEGGRKILANFQGYFQKWQKAGAQKNGSTQNWDYLKKMRETKDALKRITGNDKEYYGTLGNHGYEKANQVTDPKAQITLYQALELRRKEIERRAA